MLYTTGFKQGVGGGACSPLFSANKLILVINLGLPCLEKIVLQHALLSEFRGSAPKIVFKLPYLPQPSNYYNTTERGYSRLYGYVVMGTKGTVASRWRRLPTTLGVYTDDLVCVHDIKPGPSPPPSLCPNLPYRQGARLDTIEILNPHSNDPIAHRLSP